MSECACDQQLHSTPRKGLHCCARSQTWLQILADVLQTELIAPPAEEGAAYGAAILAMVGVGAYADLDTAFKILPPMNQVVRPQANPACEAAFKRYELLYKALKTVRNPVY